MSIISILVVKADEGMWLLSTLGKNVQSMKRAGLKLSSEEIYSANKSSLKDAIIIFGGGCTGEIVSSEGLVFTNHHCGYSYIQALSSMEHNWLKNGFWAKNYEEELPAQGLKVTFIREIIDVTDQITVAIKNEKEYDNQRKIIIDVIKKIESKYTDSEKNISANVVGMFEDNQFILFVKETFGDVRLVGVGPESIGKYGGDTDNWMWPRHTGDFSIFRVYADQNNRSTKGFNKENIPYKPKQHLTVSTKGYRQGDYSMILGFPGSTDRYMTTWEIDTKLNITDPILIYIRGEKQEIWKKDMNSSEKIRLQYANKYASSSNYWKNSIGMSKGIRKLHLRDRKQNEQDAFTNWVNEDQKRIEEYGEALNYIMEGQKGLDKYIRYASIIRECVSGIETYRMVNNGNNTQYWKKYFKDYNASTDRKTTKRMFEIMIDSLNSDECPEFLLENKDRLTDFVDDIFQASIFTDSVKYKEALKLENFKEIIRNDTLTKLFSKIVKSNKNNDINKYQDILDKGHHLYLKGLMEMRGIETMYPDANFTLRMTYGNILPYRPADAVFYDYFTTLEGVVAKEDKNNPEFELEPKLKELLAAKDYGRWKDKDGTLHVNFLSTNDITGGNSGSPVLNSKGELIGLAFDGNWEAMSGDVAFEPELQRTISLDVRYLLFIVEKFADAKNIINELTLN